MPVYIIYQLVINNTIIQYGTSYFGDYGGTINLPISYTTNYVAVATHYTRSGSNTYTVRINGVQLSSFQVYSTNWAIDVMWVSVGY